MAGRISVGKANPVLGEAINVRRLVEGTAKAGEITPTHVVDQKEHDIRRLGHSLSQKKQSEKKRETKFDHDSLNCPSKILNYQLDFNVTVREKREFSPETGIRCLLASIPKTQPIVF